MILYPAGGEYPLTASGFVKGRERWAWLRHVLEGLRQPNRWRTSRPYYRGTACRRRQSNYKPYFGKGGGCGAPTEDNDAHCLNPMCVFAVTFYQEIILWN